MFRSVKPPNKHVRLWPLLKCWETSGRWSYQLIHHRQHLAAICSDTEYQSVRGCMHSQLAQHKKKKKRLTANQRAAASLSADSCLSSWRRRNGWPRGDQLHTPQNTQFSLYLPRWKETPKWGDRWRGWCHPKKKHSETVWYEKSSKTFWGIRPQISQTMIFMSSAEQSPLFIINKPPPQ